MNAFHPYTMFPLGDSALTIEFGSCIDRGINARVLKLFRILKNSNLPFITGLVPAYASLSVFYDVQQVTRMKKRSETAFATLAGLIETFTHYIIQDEEKPKRIMEIPACYAPAFAPDMEELEEKSGLSADEITGLHTLVTYDVYMLGFLPGFPYLGLVDERIAIARKIVPRHLVAAGSIGIAGRQTGIYPLNSPGGWQIIGRTPIVLFDRNKENPAYLQPGDQVKFYPISEDEFENYQSRNS